MVQPYKVDKAEQSYISMQLATMLLPQYQF